MVMNWLSTTYTCGLQKPAWWHLNPLMGGSIASSF